MKNKRTVFVVAVCLTISQCIFSTDSFDKSASSTAWHLGKYSIVAQLKNSESDRRKFIAAAGGFKGKQPSVKKSSRIIPDGIEERAKLWQIFQAQGPKANKFGSKR